MATTTTTKPNSPSKFQTQIAGMISGFTNDLPTTVKTLTIAATSMTVSQILTQLNAIKTTLDNVATTKTAWAEAVAARKAAMAADRTFYENLVMAVKLLFGMSATQLGAFGVSLPKVKAKPTVKAAAIAKAKSAATRALRGTKGKKQKAQITLAGSIDPPGARSRWPGPRTRQHGGGGSCRCACELACASVRGCGAGHSGADSARGSLTASSAVLRKAVAMHHPSRAVPAVFSPTRPPTLEARAQSRAPKRR